MNNGELIITMALVKFAYLGPAICVTALAVTVATNRESQGTAAPPSKPGMTSQIDVREKTPAM